MPCHTIEFQCRFEKGEQAVLVSAQFIERTDLWSLKLAQITRGPIIHAIWHVAKKKWILGYNNHTTYGFKILAKDWLK